MPAPRATRVLMASLLGLVLSMLGASVALAHAGFAGSDPAAGAVVASPPEAISLSFTEPPDPSVSFITLYEGDAGREIPVSAPEIGRDPKQLVVRPSQALSDGLYTVSWRVTSRTDGHATAGAFAFRVGPATDVAPAPVVAAPEVPGPQPLGVLAKMAFYAGAIVLVGAAAMIGWIISRARERDAASDADRADPSLRAWLMAGAGIITVLGAAGMLLAESRTVGVPLGDLVNSPTGAPFVRLLIVAAITAVCAIAAAIWTRSRPIVFATGAAAAVAMLVRAMSGHPAASEPAWPQELLQFLHFCAAGTWIGGLIWTLLLLRRTMASTGGPDVIGPIRRYSRSAGIAVAVVLVTGTLRAIDEAGGLGQVQRLLLDTSYGTTLAIKVAVALMIIAFGAVNRYRSIPRLEAATAATVTAEGGGLLRRLMTIEAIGAVGVFALTGVLTSLPPQPAGSGGQPERPAAITATASDFATTFQASLSATPGSPGANDYRLTLTDYDGTGPVDADEVELRFSPVAGRDIAPTQVEMASDDPASGTWTGSGAELSLPGIWEIRTRETIGATATEVTMYLSTIPTTVPSPPVMASQAGLPDVLTFTVEGGNHLQVTVDPGTSGVNQVHVTTFDASGAELPLTAAAVLATETPDGPGSLLEMTRLSTGHFVANGDLGAGDYRFDIAAVTKDGATLQASFDQAIGTA